MPRLFLKVQTSAWFRQRSVKLAFEPRFFLQPKQYDIPKSSNIDLWNALDYFNSNQIQVGQEFVFLNPKSYYLIKFSP